MSISSPIASSNSSPLTNNALDKDLVSNVPKKRYIKKKEKAKLEKTQELEEKISTSAPKPISYVLVALYAI